MSALTITVQEHPLLRAAAFITRFYNLGQRVMSHDESLHVYYSYAAPENDPGNRMVNVANLTILKVGTLGRVQLYNYVGNVDLVVDVVGYFTS